MILLASMYARDDTIVAVATPPGRGGIGIVRISGPGAVVTAKALLRRSEPLVPRLATVSTVVCQTNGQGVDRVLVTHFPKPASYTGEDVVEISGHGSPVLLGRIVELAVAAGARLAEPGEFTLRAFLNGRLDLVQAEAVGDLITAVTPLQARAAFDQLEGTFTTQISEIESAVFDLVTRLEASVDFPDEGYHFVEPATVSVATHRLVERADRLLADAHRGRLVREGCHVVILGKPNVGKSTLFNLLLGVPRAIVTDVAGTTRDLLTETVELGGIPITLVDTAGIHPTIDTVESEGVKRARGALDVARVVLLVLDHSRPPEAADVALLDETRSLDRVVVINKIDLPSAWPDVDHPAGVQEGAVVRVSLLDDGREALTRVSQAVTRVLLGGEQLRDPPAITNLRHIELLERARHALARASIAADARAPEELVLADLAEAQEALGAVTGQRTSDDVLNRIFSEFCIGK